MFCNAGTGKKYKYLQTLVGVTPLNIIIRTLFLISVTPTNGLFYVKYVLGYILCSEEGGGKQLHGAVQATFVYKDFVIF
jgi:hypothetical protein